MSVVGGDARGQVRLRQLEHGHETETIEILLAWYCVSFWRMHSFGSYTPAHRVRLWLYGANRGCCIDLKPGEQALLSWYTECKDNDVDPVRVEVKDFYSGSTPRKLCFSNIFYTVRSCYTGSNFSGDFVITSVHSGGGKPEGFTFTRRLIGPVYRVSYE